MRQSGKVLSLALFLIATILIGLWVTVPQVNAAPVSAPSVSITLNPAADAYVTSAQRSTNFGTSADLFVSSINTVAVIEANTLMRFDLSAIPAGSIIESAKLTLAQSGFSNAEDWTLEIGRITQGWNETEVTYATQPPSDPTGLTLLSLGQSDIEVRADITALVRQWRYQPFAYPNYGLMLSGSAFSASRTFVSAEGRTPPTLVIEYTPPSAAITIPYATDDGKIDAICDTGGEYANALRYQYIDYLGAVGTLYLKQDDTFLYTCIEGADGNFPLRYFSLYLDRNNGREKYADTDDLSLQIRVEDGAMSSFMGTGQSTNTWEQSSFTDWQAATRLADTIFPEAAEYQVPLAEIATTCGQPFGIALYHHWVTDNGVDFGWPTNTASFSPNTWVEAQLERPLCPIQVCWESATNCQAATGATVYATATTDTYVVDRGGYVINREQIADGEELWAMIPISVTENYTLYYTSGVPQTVSIAAYDDEPTGQMTLVVSEQNPLMLHNLDISAQWNLEGDAAYKAQLRDNIIAASEHLYDFTNGQMALGTVNVRQNYEGWDDADTWLFASNNLRPEAGIGGKVESTTVDPEWDGTGDKHKLVYEPGRVYMGATWNRFGLPGVPISGTGGMTETVDTSGDWASVLAHELGHYLLFLDDTYFRFRDDLVIEAVYSCVGSGMGWVYFEENTEFVFNEEYWKQNCLHTSRNDQLQRTEWKTLRLWYPWMVDPSDDPGPTALPTPLTQVNFIAPTGASVPVVNQLFDLDYRDGETASAEARAVLFRNNRVIDQGKPTKGTTQITLHGAQAGDRFCLIDINDNAQAPETPRNQYGCETIAAGDNTLFLEKNSAWAPVILIDPITPTIPGGTTLAISVTQPADAGSVLKARVYPEHKDEVNEVTLSGAGSGYSGILHLPFTPAAYVQLFIDESEAPDGTNPRREAIIDYGIGGGGLPGPTHNVGWAPIISSSDGRAFFVLPSGLTLDSGQFIALQSMAGTPKLPANATIVDQPYRLIAYPQRLVEDGSINLRFNTTLPLQAASSSEEMYALHFWNGTQWLPLETTLTTEAEGNQLASAPSQGVGIYALLRTTGLTDIVYLPFIQR